MIRSTTALFATLILSLAGMVISVLTIMEHVLIDLSSQTGLTLETGLCVASGAFNCKKVIASEWSTWLGIPLGFYGLAFYLAASTLSIAAFDKKFFGGPAASGALLVWSVVGVVVSLSLFAISWLKIQAFCPLCMASYAVNGCLLISTFFLDSRVPISSRMGTGLRALILFPWSFLNLRAPRETRIPHVARVWLVAGIALVGLMAFVPDVLITQLKVPKVEKNSPAERIARGVSRWSDARIQELAVNLEGGVSGDFFKGSPGAPVQIVGFSDFQCPACRAVYEMLSELLKNYGDSVVWIHKDYPLDHNCNPGIPDPFHQWACLGAQVARCAGEQGKFMEATDYIYRSSELSKVNTEKEARPLLLGMAAIIGLDQEGLEECVQSQRHLPKVQQDVALGDSLGIQGTPTYWINGKRVEVIHPQVFEQIIAKAGGTSAVVP